jgi:hypothetical protein
MAKVELATVRVGVKTEARLQENKRELEKRKYKEVPPKDDKDLIPLKEYFVTGRPGDWTITYIGPLPPAKEAKPL